MQHNSSYIVVILSLLTLLLFLLLLCLLSLALLHMNRYTQPLCRIITSLTIALDDMHHHHHHHHLQHFLFHSNCLFHLSHLHRFLFVACCIVDHINHIAVAWTLDCNHIVYVCIRSLKSLRCSTIIYSRALLSFTQQQQQNNNRRRRHDATIWTTHSTEYTMLKLRWIK